MKQDWLYSRYAIGRSQEQVIREKTKTEKNPTQVKNDNTMTEQRRSLQTFRNNRPRLAANSKHWQRLMF